MTTEEARILLLPAFPDLAHQIEQHLLTHDRQHNGIAGSQDVDSRLAIFQEYNDKRLLRFLSEIKLPQDKEFDAHSLKQYAQRAYLKGLYPYIVLASQSMYWKRIRKEVSLEEYQESHPEIESDTNTEEEYMLKVAQEEMEKAMKQFNKMLHPQELVVWELRKKTAPIRHACQILYPDCLPTQKIEDKIRYRYNLLDYRFLCLVTTKQIFFDSLMLKGLNKSPPLNNKFFGSRVLERLPLRDDLLRAARGEENTITTTEGILKWTPAPILPRVDFNGKKHDHIVKYVSDTGFEYDHVTKQIRRT